MYLIDYLLTKRERERDHQINCIIVLFMKITIYITTQIGLIKLA